jgi:molybdopterin converting factor subunit 1
MQIRVLFFAALQERVGERQITVDVAEPATVGDVYGDLSERFPGLAGHGRSLMFAVNADYVTPDQPLKDGDELALIPPVSGGAL